MRRASVGRSALAVSILVFLAASAAAQDRGSYADLLEIFGEFRAFSQAGNDGATADYPAAMEERAGRLAEFQQRLPLRQRALRCPA